MPVPSQPAHTRHNLIFKPSCVHAHVCMLYIFHLWDWPRSVALLPPTHVSTQIPVWPRPRAAGCLCSTTCGCHNHGSSRSAPCGNRPTAIGCSPHRHSICYQDRNTDVHWSDGDPRLWLQQRPGVNPPWDCPGVLVHHIASKPNVELHQAQCCPTGFGTKHRAY